MGVVFGVIQERVVKNDKENNDKGAGWGGIRSCHIRNRNAMITERNETKRKPKKVLNRMLSSAGGAEDPVSWTVHLQLPHQIS